MDNLQIKVETGSSETGDQSGSESATVSEEISQQDQNAQLFIEALLQASQNQLLTESAVLAMNQLWMGSRGVLAQTGQGNISLAAPGNISAAGPGNISVAGTGNVSLVGPGNISLAGPGNISVAGSGNLSSAVPANVTLTGSGTISLAGANTVSLPSTGNISQSSDSKTSFSTDETVSLGGQGCLVVGNHGSLSLGNQGNSQVGSQGNTAQIGQVNIVQPGQLDAVRFTNQIILQGNNIISSQSVPQIHNTSSQPMKDSHIKQALAAPFRVSQMGKVVVSGESKVKDVQSATVVSEAAVLPHGADAMATDFSMADTSNIVHLRSNSAIAASETVQELMDTSEGTGGNEQTFPHSVIVTSAEQTLSQPNKKSTSVSSVGSPKKKSRRQSSSTSSHATDGSTTPSSGVTKTPQAQEKAGSEIVNRATTPRRRGSHMSEGGRRSRPLSECEGDLTPDTPSLVSAYSSDDLRRQMAGSVTPDTDIGFQPSMLDAVLTEKKLALLRSPEVRQFLHQQQMQRAKERSLTHSARASCSKGDNSI